MRLFSSRAQAGLVILGMLVLVWISTLPRLDVSREVRMPKLRSPWTPQTIDDLQVAALNRDVPVFEPGRNIFAFSSPPIAHRSGTKDRGEQKIQKDDEKRDPTPQDPALDVAFLGVFGPQRLRIAVLKDRDGESVSNILERDLVEDRYRVLEIESKSVLLRDTASPNAAPIRLEIP